MIIRAAKPKMPNASIPSLNCSSNVLSPSFPSSRPWIMMPPTRETIETAIVAIAQEGVSSIHQMANIQMNAVKPKRRTSANLKNPIRYRIGGASLLSYRYYSMRLFNCPVSIPDHTILRRSSTPGAQNEKRAPARYAKGSRSKGKRKAVFSPVARGNRLTRVSRYNDFYPSRLVWRRHRCLPTCHRAVSCNRT